MEEDKRNFQYIPTVSDMSGRIEKQMDLVSKLLAERIIFLTGEVNTNSCALVCAQLLYLAAEDPNKDIHLYINSPGGSIHDGLSVIDTMNYIKPHVCTYGMGICASMGAVLLAAGEPGKRYGSKRLRVMLHEAAGGYSGKNVDFKIYATEMDYINSQMIDFLATVTKQKREYIYELIRHGDHYMSVEDSLEMGLIDQIIQPGTSPTNKEKKKKLEDELKDTISLDDHNDKTSPADELIT